MAKQKESKFEEKELREGMTEIQSGRRTFETKKYGVVQIRFPKPEENRLAEYEYSRMFNQAMMQDKLPTNKKMEEFLRENGVWTEEDDKKIEDIRKQIDEQIIVLGKMKTEKGIKPTEAKIAELRSKLIEMQTEKQKYFNNTAEAKAEEVRIAYLISKCTEIAETGESVWKTYNDYKSEEDNDTLNIIAYQFLTFINGLPVDFLDFLPEEGELTEENGEQDGE